MTDSSKSRLMAALVLATICLPAGAKDPNHPTTGLRFEVDQTTVDWVSTDQYGGRSSRIPTKEGIVRPSHRAQLFILNLSSSWTSGRGEKPNVDFQGPGAIRKILETPAGQKISPAQRKFLEAGRALYKSGGFRDEGLAADVDHFCFWVYAVSKDDAEKTVQALIQFLTAEAEAKLQAMLSECKKVTEDVIPEKKKTISETESQIKAVETKLDSLKKIVHYVSTEEAMQTVLEFNKTLNTLEVEVAGLQAKVSANKEYMAQAKLTNEALTKLQQILADHIIELAGALARKETATKIRDQAKDFYDLHTQLAKLPKDLNNLRASLARSESGLERAKEDIANPRGGALPPKVFENKVVINLVSTD